MHVVMSMTLKQSLAKPLGGGRGGRVGERFFFFLLGTTRRNAPLEEVDVNAQVQVDVQQELGDEER